MQLSPKLPCKKLTYFFVPSNNVLTVLPTQSIQTLSAFNISPLYLNHPLKKHTHKLCTAYLCRAKHTQTRYTNTSLHAFRHVTFTRISHHRLNVIIGVAGHKRFVATNLLLALQQIIQQHNLLLLTDHGRVNGLLLGDLLSLARIHSRVCVAAEVALVAAETVRGRGQMAVELRARQIGDGTPPVHQLVQLGD